MISAIRSACIATMAGLTAWLGVAVAAPLDPMAGSWRGEEAAGASIDAADLNMRVTPRSDGFDLAWTEPGMPGNERTVVKFFETDRPGIFVEGEGGGWLFSMLGGDKRLDPLKGDTLRWARVEGDRLMVYRLDVAEDGGYRLDRYAWDNKGGELDFSFERRTHDGDPVQATGHLVRAGEDE